MADAALSALFDSAQVPTQYSVSRQCVHCGVQFERSGRELRKYCSDECMKDRNRLIRKGAVKRQCEWCQSGLVDQPPATKFCTIKCREISALHYRKERNEIEADKLRKQARDWYYANKEKALIRRDEWGKKNPDKIKQISAKRRSTPHGKLSNAMRVGVHKSLTKGKMGKRTFEVLGYSVNQLKEHLERQFSQGMSWDNYGEWHVDHIVPVSSFKYDEVIDPDFKACWALSNLRPMWAEDNISKHAKRLFLI
jgi:endogenous inhibitor of DNA gyrase (YacG/DUF329 family)